MRDYDRALLTEALPLLLRTDDAEDLVQRIRVPSLDGAPVPMLRHLLRALLAHVPVSS
jgi:hypothetical protein